LGDTGVFVSQRSAESFDIKIERDAALAEFTEDPGRSPRLWFERKSPEFLERVRRECSLIAEASDRYFRVLVGDAIFAVESLQTHRLVEALVRDPGK
jgi:hypothetical protein